MSRAVALLLTALTGFSGLVYEVGWQKYLATLLGSHSEATATVLAIFLGGLSLGYQIFGRVTRRLVARAEERGTPPRLLLFYGALEAGIGAYVIVFPTLFEGIRALSYAFPHGVGGLGFAIDVALSALLIGPPSVLMGGTIPVLTQALARSLADATRFHAFVYAFNTFGAFVGALAAGFYLVPRLGLVNVMYAMGAINLFAGATFALLGMRAREVVDLRESVEEGAPRVTGFAAYAAVALLVGFAMMAVQTTAIRIAGLSFGSSQFTFSIVVAVFVVCIALGSFAVSALSRIPPALVVLNQWVLALLLLALYPALPRAPYWAQQLRAIFRDDQSAFYPYQTLSFLAVLAVVGPAVVLSGATLPLLFHQLRRQAGHLGDLAGWIYSWNTVGSLLGALLGGYVLLFWLDLHHVYRISVAALFVAAALVSIQVYSLGAVQAWVLVPFLAVIVLLRGWDPTQLTVGLFRERQPLASRFPGPDGARQLAFRLSWGNSKMVFYDDDPTTTVSVREHSHPDGGDSISIATGGKSDGDTKNDNQTMRLIAVLPAMMADQLERAFVIGYGTGMTVGELASYPSMREVVVAEISRGVIRAAPIFDRANRGASVDSKVRIVNSDAYRALMRSEGTFDVIASEPSNPWVTGVEMLFSREFLEAAKARLSPGGVHAQWIHQYEIDDRSLELVLRTYRSVFDHVSVWTAYSNDIVLLGFRSQGSGIDHYRLRQRATEPAFAASLARAEVSSFPALLAHELIPLGAINAAPLPGSVHTLLRPQLNDMAGRAFFRGTFANLPFLGVGDAAREGSRHSMIRGYTASQGGRLPDDQRAELVAEACRYRGKMCQVLLAAWQRDEPESLAFQRALEAAARSDTALTPDQRKQRLADIISLFPGPAAPRNSVVPPATAARITDLFFSLYLHSEPFDGEKLIDLWSRCRDEALTFGTCEEDMKRAREQFPVEDEAELMARIPSCGNKVVIGKVCQEGMSRAQRMLAR
jgi:spermidine synthase